MSSGLNIVASGVFGAAFGWCLAAGVHAIVSNAPRPFRLRRAWTVFLQWEDTTVTSAQIEYLMSALARYGAVFGVHRGILSTSLTARGRDEFEALLHVVLAVEGALMEAQVDRGKLSAVEIEPLAFQRTRRLIARLARR